MVLMMPGAKRRSTKELPAVSRSYIENLINKVDQTTYGESIQPGLSPAEQRMRNKALIVLLYLSARRISEIVGRVYKYPNGEEDRWVGVAPDDLEEATVENLRVLRMHVRILKRGTKAKTLKLVMRPVDMRIEDPLMPHLLKWLKFAKEHRYQRAFPISRGRAWQIMNELDPNIWNHWFRHQRITHLSSTMSPFELKAFAKFAKMETALDYIHESPARILRKTEEADKLWK